MSLDSNQSNYRSFKRNNIIEESRKGMISFNQIQTDSRNAENKQQKILLIGESEYQQHQNVQTAQETKKF